MKVVRKRREVRTENVSKGEQGEGGVMRKRRTYRQGIESEQRGGGGNG